MAFGIDWLCWPLLLLIFIVGYVIYMSWYRSHFTSQGVPMAGKWLPIFGTSLRIFKEGMIEGVNGNHEKYGKTYGGLSGRIPVLTTIDTDILREVFIKDHVSFPYRFTIRTGDPLDDNMLNNVTDYAHWKSLRSTMTPAFSSGKLKRMMKQINVCAAVYAGHLTKESQNEKSLEMKEFAGSFTMDVIASTAFGLELNTKEDRNNPFVQQSRNALDIKVTHPSIVCTLFFPFLLPLLRLFKISFFDRQCKTFFTDITNQVLDSRKNCDTKGNVDFLQLMMNAHKEEDEENKEDTKGKRALTRQEMVSQAVLFFLAGYDTTATTISFLAYNMACNPEQQNKLIEEVQEVMGDRQEVTDDDVHKMPYLEMCVSESLRIYPPGIRIDRTAARDVVLKGIHLPKGSLVVIPIYHIHHYAEFYPDPEAFIPERFSPEEKARRDPLLYQPFGAGPRNCIASRLALLEVKVAMVHVLRTHRFVCGPDTQVPIKFANAGELLKPENGIWLKLEKHTE